MSATDSASTSRICTSVCSLSTSFSVVVCPRTMWAISWKVVLCGSAARGFTAISRAREIAVNPLAALPHKTTFHEIAHIVLGHTTSEKLVDGEQTTRHIREVEAESVALICCETLGLDGAEFCRGYIQHWLKTEKEIPNQSAARIFAAATSILKAGTPATGSQ